jgi:hypothetical protein
MKNLAPIILFVYNRLDHTKQTVEALKNNELASESELFIYSDAPKDENAIQKVNEVREYIKLVIGFKNITIIEREKNWGLANSIIDGVTNIVNHHGKVIILEDDLVTSPYFLKFMNNSLEIYADRKDIFSITGFSFSQEFMKFDKNHKEDVYLNVRPMSWSWASWKDRWDNIDWDVKDFENLIKDKNKIKKFNSGGSDLTSMLTSQIKGKLDSWYIRWSYHAIMRNLYTIYPTVSLVNNIGHDNSGTHSKVDKNNIYNHSELNTKDNISFNKKIKIDLEIIKKFNKGFNYNYKKKIKRKLKNLFERFKAHA